MNVTDIVILIALALGAIGGFKSGVIKKTANFVGIFIIIILSFYLKNYLSVIMYENLPFINFGGFIKGIEAINILFYEVLAFVIVYSLLYLVFKVVLMLTGLIEKILKATVILSIPSKILGIFVGIIEMYVYVFLILVVITLPIINIPYVRDSKIANFMLDKTPILSKVSEDMVDTYDTIQMDTTYWGRGFGLMVIRDAVCGKVLWHKYVHHETIAQYVEGVDWLKDNGFRIYGAVIDEIKGLPLALKPVPVQMC